jgi:hypothetical protein
MESRCSTWQALVLAAGSQVLLSLATTLFFKVEHVVSVYNMFLGNGSLGHAQLSLRHGARPRLKKSQKEKPQMSSQPRLDIQPVTPAGSNVLVRTAEELLIYRN